MSELNSIHEFFSKIGCRFQCFDMSRLIRPISQQDLIDFEQTSSSWKTPFKQHAWLAILFWPPLSMPASESELNLNHYIWFLKLPLDEQAKLNLVARDDFLRRLVEALTGYLEQSDTAPDRKLESLENSMKDNPYGFQPKQEQLANLHAIVHQQLSLPPSGYYPQVQDYFSGAGGFEHWTELGYQGIADLAARLDEEYEGCSNEQLITNAIARLPASPFQVLSMCLENHRVSEQLVDAVSNRLEIQLNQDIVPNNIPVPAAIRATAQASNKDQQAQLLTTVLTSHARFDIEVLATISGRCWLQLCNPEILALFLEALANTEHGQGAFNAIIADLMFIPGMRDTIVQAFRSPERSEPLARAIGLFFSHLQH